MTNHTTQKDGRIEFPADMDAEALSDAVFEGIKEVFLDDEVTKIADNTFAAACFDQNSVAELEQALAGEPDATDCAEWNLTPEQWRAEIELALAAKRGN